MNTKLLYLENMHDLEAEGHVERVELQDDRVSVYLEETILYPQGGGQPYDTGVIASEDTKFVVEEVRFVDGAVHHIGRFEGRPFIAGEKVRIVVDSERRQLHARLHSGGHLIDMAVSELGLDWLPGKGYHFPDNPYVEYDGQFELEGRDELMRQIAELGKRYIEQDLPVSCRFVGGDELERICRHVPDNLPANKPIRVVQFDGFAVPCGGTHVRSLKELVDVRVTKLKRKDKNIRVGYDVNRQF